MFLNTVLLQASLAAAALAQAETNVLLTSVAQFRDPSSYRGHEMCGFRLEGTCLCTLGTNFILDDGTGRSVIYVEKERSMPKAGSRVLVSGQACVGWMSDLFNDIHQQNADCRPMADGEPPDYEPTSVGELVRTKPNCHLVRFTGTVTDAFRDDIDMDCCFLQVRDGHATLTVGLSLRERPNADLAGLVDARVEVCGAYLKNYTGLRIYQDAIVYIPREGSIRVVEKAPTDPFSAISVDELHSTSPQDISAHGRVSAVGTVLAIRRDGRIVLRSYRSRIINVSTLPQKSTPAVGSRVRVVGYPKTDLYHINLVRSLWRPEPGRTAPEEAATDVDVATLLGDERTRQAPDVAFHGRTVCLTGTVRMSGDYGRAIPVLNVGERTVLLETPDENLLPDGMADGCRIEATGVWAVDTDNWQSDAVLPRIKGFALVLRRPSDVRILAQPPWWTPRRFLITILALLAALVGFFIWNRALNRLVIRRSRQLHREELARAVATQQIDERTRLAAELHDSLSQNLSAIACQVNVAKNVLAAETESRDLLEAAERMLQSTRTELTRCLWDLRGHALEEKDLSEAVRQTLATLALPERTSVDITVPRTRLNETAAHAVLCIIRELTANAIRHGQASEIAIVGRTDGATAEFSVADNGCGFSSATRPGPNEGHFGLDGIVHRVRRMNGSFDIQSEVGGGTRAVFRFTL